MSDTGGGASDTTTLSELTYSVRVVMSDVRGQKCRDRYIRSTVLNSDTSTWVKMETTFWICIWIVFNAIKVTHYLSYFKKEVCIATWWSLYRMKIFSNLLTNFAWKCFRITLWLFPLVATLTQLEWTYNVKYLSQVAWYTRRKKT